ncbi:MAG: glycosyltransferase [Patescibacteria group bacterium]
MAVYNGQEYLNTAIDSILLQTHKNLELVIIDDGSTDNSRTIIETYGDKRIRYIHQSNKGLAAALNHGIKQSSGTYIARMDCDDISYPTRIAEQLKYLEKNPSVALVGSGFDLIDQDGRIIDRSIHLDRPSDVGLEFLVRNPFGHGTIMMRKKALETTGFYDVEQPIEDYELWWRISSRYPVANMAKQLYGWRVNPDSISHKGDAKRQIQITKLMSEIWENQTKVKLSKAAVKTGLKHYASLGPKYQEQYVYFVAALCIALRKKKRYLEATKLQTIVWGLPKGRAVLKDIRRNPRSHNYNLVNIKQ